MKLSMKKVSAVKNMDDLKALGIGNIICDISGRGGGLGFYRADVAKAADVPEELLPGKFGAYCNYLGGGVRGAICVSGFSANVELKKSLLLKALQEACVRVYKNLEDEAGMNDEIGPDGEINWDAKAANASRAAGIVSAY